MTLTDSLLGSTFTTGFMAKADSKRGNDSQSGKPAKEKVNSAEQSDFDDSEVCIKPPSRVHIFTNKPPQSGSSKSSREPLKCSSLRTDRPVEPEHRAPADIFVELRHSVGFKEGLVRLGRQIEKSKHALYEAAMKAEDLEAILQGLQRTCDSIFARRQCRTALLDRNQPNAF